MRKPRFALKFIPLILVVALAGILIGASVVHIMTNVLTPTGEVSYAAEIPAEIKQKIATQLADLELTENLNFSLQTSSTAIPVTISEQSNSDITTYTYSFPYQIYVPVTGFYNPTSSITEDDFNALISNFSLKIETPSIEPDSTAVTLIPLNDLNNTIKLLSVDQNYYLDELDSGAVFVYINLSSNNRSELETAINLLQADFAAFPETNDLLTFAQTGVTALSRGMYTKLLQVENANFFSQNITAYLSSFDLTHTSNEASFTEFASSQNICSAPEMIDVLTSIGLDIVELTGNHNQECGDQAALDTLDLYTSLNIQTVGGGSTATDAALPLELSQKGTSITLLAYNLSTGGYTQDDTPGANFYTEEKASADIAQAKARGDIIIVDVQYYECSEYVNTAEDTTCDYADSAAGDQVGFFRQLIDMGADVVVGTAAHQPQTYELYHDGVIYYGLGNLFFDQYWWPGTTRSLILAHYFLNGQLIQTKLVPTVYDSNYQTTLMDATSATDFIARLNQARPLE